MSIDATSNIAQTVINPDDLQHIPADLNVKTPQQKQLYGVAVEFERFFVQNLMKNMQQATQAIGGSADSSSSDSDSSSTDSLDSSSDDDPSVSTYQGMITDQMTQAVLDGGGLGLAAVMYKSMVGSLPADGAASTAAPTGGESV